MTFNGYFSVDLDGKKEFYVSGSTITKKGNSDVLPIDYYDREVFPKDPETRSEEGVGARKFFRHREVPGPAEHESNANILNYRIRQIEDIVFPDKNSLIERIIFRDSTETTPIGEIELRVEGNKFYTKSTKYESSAILVNEYKIKEGIDSISVLENAHNSIMNRLRDLETKRRYILERNSIISYEEARKNRALLKAVDETFKEAEASQTASEIVRKAANY